LTITDATGTSLTLNKMPERVVCFSEACLDALAELDVLPVATRTFMYPVAINPRIFGDKAKNIGQVPDSGDSINFEELARQKPDLVIGYSGDAIWREGIKPIAPLYLMGDAKDITAAITELKKVATIFGRTAQAEAAAKRLTDKLAAYKAKSPRDVSVLVMANYTAGNQQYVATSQSATCVTLNEVVKCGLDAPPVFSGYAQPSLESILGIDPQVLLVVSVLISPPNSYSQAIVDQQKQSKQDLLNNPIWKNLSAVKNGRVYEVDRTSWYATPGTRMIGFTLDDTMTKIYPNIFPKPLP
jgi:iron complex transport system substrate-binding protein